jgi:hypothetical protein
MRVFIVATAAITFLAGCGGFGQVSDKQALVTTCIEKGENEATCNCVAGALEAKLSPELYKQVAQAAGREKQDMFEYMSSLPVEDLLAFSAVTNDLAACGETAATGG